MNGDFARFLDTMSKLDAKSRLPSGGSQYTMEVALGPSASAKHQALMRVQKVKPASTVGLGELIRRCK